MSNRKMIYFHDLVEDTFLFFYYEERDEGRSPTSYSLRDYSHGGAPQLIRGRLSARNDRC